MSTKKNAACEAVEAAALPSVGQIQLLACKLLEVSVGYAIHSCEDESQDYDAINVAELALDGVRDLTAKLPMEFHAFVCAHARIASAAMLACDAYSNKDSATWRFLNRAATGFSSIVGALEIADEARKKGGAA